MAKQAHTPHFHIAFDTNFLISEAENKLLNKVASEFIQQANKTENPKVTWHLLDLVRAERRHQMLQVALRLLVQVDKVGRLLGKNFGITRSSLEGGIDAVIKAEVAKHCLKLHKLDSARVDWPALIDRSTAREPPFEDVGKNEKGFRDSIILETFAQLVERLSGERGQRFVLVTKDCCLKDATIERMKHRNDVVVVEDTPDLKSILNASASHISGADLEALLKSANKFFYVEGDKDTLFYKWDLEQRIRTEHGAALLAPPSDKPAASVSARVAFVGTTSFIKKFERKFTFTTYIDFALTAEIPINVSDTGFVYFPNVPTGTGVLNMGTIYPSAGTTLLTTGGGFPSSSSVTLSTSSLGYPITDFITAGGTASGAHTTILNTGSMFSGTAVGAGGQSPTALYQGGRKIFEVEWCATLEPGGDIKDPELIGMRILSTEW